MLGLELVAPKKRPIDPVPAVTGAVVDILPFLLSPSASNPPVKLASVDPPVTVPMSLVLFPAEPTASVVMVTLSPSLEVVKPVVPNVEVPERATSTA